MPLEGRPNLAAGRSEPLIKAEMIENGEYKLPFWADLEAFSPFERRALWGMMVGNEGRTE